MAKWLIPIAALLSTCSPGSLAAQLTQDTVTVVSGFVPDARSASLGGSLVSQVRDASAVFWNPSLLSGQRDRSLMLSIDEPFAFDFAAVTQFVPLFGTLGLSLARVQTSSETIDRGTAAWGKSVTRRLSLGANFNLEKQAGDWATSLGLAGFLGNPRIGTLDLGWQDVNSPSLWDRLNLGIMVQNIPLIDNQLQTSVLLGASYLLPAPGFLFNGGYHLLDGASTSHLGLAYQVNRGFRLSAGLDDGDLENWAVGLGYQQHNFALHFSYSAQVEKLLVTTSARIGPAPVSSARPHYSKATEHARAGDLRAASREFKKYLSFDLDEARSDSVKRIVYFLDRRLARAGALADSLMREARKQLAKREPQFLRAALLLIRVRQVDPSHEEAGKQLLTLKPAVDSFVKRTIQRGIDRYDANEYDAAKRLFSRVLVFEKNNATANYYIDSIAKVFSSMGDEHFYQGVGYYQQEDLVRAKQEFEKALELHPEHRDAAKFFSKVSAELTKKRGEIAALLQKGKSLNAQKKYSEATNTFVRVLQIDKDNQEAKAQIAKLRPKVAAFVNSRFSKARTYYTAGQLREAEKVLRHIISIDPAHREAKAYLRRIDSEEQDLVSEYLTQADLHAKAGEWDRAVAAFDQVLDIDPGNDAAEKGREAAARNLEINTLLSNADKLGVENKVLEALAVYQRAYALDSTSAVVRARIADSRKRISELAEEHFNRGINYYTRDQYDKAIEELKKVLTYDSEHKGAKDYISQANERLVALRKL